jgi:hypothetical protein|tara:strand:- start:1753 stop:1938 length:186 start_codon:yes stop_codon:yes gene_type:complete
MQLSRNTSRARNKLSLMLMLKVVLVLVVIYGLVVLLNKMDFPSPNKEIEKIISYEKLKIVK